MTTKIECDEKLLAFDNEWNKAPEELRDAIHEVFFKENGAGSHPDPELIIRAAKGLHLLGSNLPQQLMQPNSDVPSSHAESEWSNGGVPANGFVFAQLDSAQELIKNEFRLEAALAALSAKQVAEKNETQHSAEACVEAAKVYLAKSELQNLSSGQRKGFRDQAKASLIDGWVITELANYPIEDFFEKLAMFYSQTGQNALQKSVETIAKKRQSMNSKIRSRRILSATVKRFVSLSQKLKMGPEKEKAFDYAQQSARKLVRIITRFSNRIEVECVLELYEYAIHFCLIGNDLFQAATYVEKCAKLSLQQNLTGWKKRMEQIGNVINDKITSADQLAKQNQLLRKNKIKYRLTRFEYRRQDKDFFGRGIAELKDGEIIFWCKESTEVRWYTFEPTDAERKEVEQRMVCADGCDNPLIVVDSL